MLKEQEERKQEREERMQEKADKALLEYVKKNQKTIGPPLMQTSIEDEDRPAKVKARIAIPFNLSNDEKTILEDFYDGETRP